MSVSTRSVFDRLGGPDPFWTVARAFYARIEADSDPTFRGMFPATFDEAVRNQAEFLIQYFGGPTTYSDRRGHPRLRLRHMPFSIDVAARNRWMEHMRAALIAAQIPSPEHEEMLAYFEHAATFLINRES
ncbi:MAG: globin [Phycisphaerae bacterium]|nr:globin [Phycisphaerae bacterium]